MFSPDKLTTASQAGNPLDFKRSWVLKERKSSHNKGSKQKLIKVSLALWCMGPLGMKRSLKPDSKNAFIRHYNLHLKAIVPSNKFEVIFWNRANLRNI